MSSRTIENGTERAVRPRPESAGAALLSIEDLRVEYQGSTGITAAVTGASLQVRRGETVALVGESGSGKSTLAHAVIGLLNGGAITGGEITFAGDRIERASQRVLRGIRGARIGLVPQDPGTSLNPVLRIGDQVAEVLRIHGRADRRTARIEAVRILEEAGLDRPELRARQYPQDLSGGQRQRVLIGIALACGPELVIADEPTSALDVTVQRRILDHLEQRTRESDAAVLLITHDLAVAAERADRIVVMQHGRIVETGTAAEVLGRPQHEYTRRLVQAAPSLDDALRPRAAEGAAARAHAGRETQGHNGSPARSVVQGSEGLASRAAAQGSTPQAGVSQAAVAQDSALEGAASHVAVTQDSAPQDAVSGVAVAQDSAPQDAVSQEVVPQTTAPQAAASHTGSRAVGARNVEGQAARSDGDPLLSVTGLRKTFHIARGVTLTAVNEVSLSVGRGETLAVVGESGSGKSTTARILARLAEPDAGTITFDGRDITRLRGAGLRELRRRIQVVYQNPYVSLNPKLTVGRIVSEPLEAFGIGDRRSRRESVGELLEQVALPREYAQRRPAELSGGQRQRVAIARALALRPELVVLDEPVSALDVSVQAQILELLERLRSELNLAYLFISHDLAVVRRLADRVAVMREGVIVETARTADLFANPQNEYTRDLLSAVPAPRIRDASSGRQDADGSAPLERTA
ncbi:dipeptide ABC transporter ATP-binding protein [Nocardia jejuensis]|uniref:dipeptide ABC transporter ATP-binding protein n=1 Tax=Nocardia jejuensis TaxID=328049 RepID=UPI00083378C6|nr:ABC transporter ATP-binding protein [Nocardia jejuensis]